MPDEQRQYLENLNGLISTGDDAREFMNTGLGRYLQQRAEEEIIDAFNQFKIIDVSEVDKVRTIQNKLLNADRFLTWIQDCIVEGQEALKQAEQL